MSPSRGSHWAQYPEFVLLSGLSLVLEVFLEIEDLTPLLNLLAVLPGFACQFRGLFPSSLTASEQKCLIFRSCYHGEFAYKNLPVPRHPTFK